MEPHLGQDPPPCLLLQTRQTYFTLGLPPELDPKNPPPPEPEPPYPPILLMARLLSNSGNTMKIPRAAANPYGKGSIICKPMLIAKDANKKIKYVLKLNNLKKIPLKSL